MTEAMVGIRALREVSKWDMIVGTTPFVDDGSEKSSPVF